jgi:hypothetical protein
MYVRVPERGWPDPRVVMEKIKGFLWGAVTVLIVSAVASATPTTVRLSTTRAALQAQVHSSAAPGGTQEDDSDADEAEVEEAEESDTEGKEEGADAEGHGAVVSAAAHCDLHGRAHGEFVSGIAHDTEATPESVEAACAEAVAAQPASVHGPNSEHGPDAEHGKNGEHGPDAEHGKSAEHGDESI